MINLKKIISALSVASLMFTTCAFAEDVDFSVDRSAAEVNFTVTAEANKSYVFVVLKDGVNKSDLDTAQNPSALISYAGNFTTNENGIATVEFELDVTDDYVLYMQPTEGTAAAPIPFYVMEKGAYTTLESAIETALTNQDSDTFYSKLYYQDESNSVDNLKALGIDNAVARSFDDRKISDLFYAECGGTLPAEQEDAEALFAASTAIVALNTNNQNTPDNMFPYISGIIEERDATLDSFVDKHVKTEAAEKFFTSLLKGKNITSIGGLRTRSTGTSLIDESKTAIILTGVKYPDGNTNIKTLFETYKGILGLSSVSSDGRVYNAIAGNSYSKIGPATESGTLLYAYNAAVKNVNSNGGNNGGGGGSAPSITITDNGGEPVVNPNEGKNPVGIKFLDIDDLDSASYEAVSRLFYMGIINGYNDNEFKPNGTVKREEFITMLVKAMNLENDSYEAGIFADTADTWCDKFVSIAYKHGLTQGVGGKNFGMGSEITRQDMAVMIYNAMVKVGFAPQGAANAFADKDAFSDYALTPSAELNALGIINGVGDDMYSPMTNATRVQSAIIINRALEYLR